MGRKLIFLLFVALLVLPLLVNFIPPPPPDPEYPTPPETASPHEVIGLFRCDGYEVNDTLPLTTTPQGFSLRGGVGIQILLSSEKMEKTLIYMAVMKLPSSDVTRRVVDQVVEYVGRSKERYELWETSIEDKRGFARFEMEGLTWEMWYRGSWIVEVGVGASGDRGEEVIREIKTCLVESFAKG